MHNTWQHRFWRAATAAAVVVCAPSALRAQIVVACDFDIADDLGRFTFGNTMHLRGPAGAASTAGQFYIINGNTSDADVDHDGYAAPGNCNYTQIFVASITNLTNVDNQALAIPSQNIIVTNLRRDLISGASEQVNVTVQIPEGTVAGTYVGRLEIRDNVIFAVPSASSRDLLNVDVITIEVTVEESRGIAAFESDSPDPLDSLVIRARAGQRATGVFRLANTGNVSLSDIQLSATDLRSESAVGISIPSENISFSAPSLASIAIGDTARVTVTVQVPRGVLNGRYRGLIFAQGEGAAPLQIPLIVIVTSTRGILFATNPVRGAQGDIAQIAFNGDPGTDFRVVIFDMNGLMVYQTRGQVFAGLGGTVQTPTSGADFAVNVGWPLVNGRGEIVASGMYYVVAESIVSGQRQIAKDRLMVIR